MPTIHPYPYDPTSPASILAHARRLKGHTLRQLVPAANSLAMGKGSFGNVLQSAYFGQAPNSRPEPDFAEAGVELKTTPLRLKGRRLVTKERLVLNLIDYMSVHCERWETSSFLAKNGQLLLVFYLHEEGKGPLDLRIEHVRLWSFPEADRKVIREDWRRIVDKVRAGRAHELSEGDTTYLAACTKGATKADRRPQPFCEIPAKPRAFALKQGYMEAVLQQYVLGKEEHVQYVLGGSEPMGFEEVVHARFAAYVGLTATEIAQRLGIQASGNAKNFHAAITKRILGIDPAHRIAEFDKGEIVQKTMRLDRRGRPEEDVSFPAFDYVELVRQDWESSDLRGQLTKRFFFVVYRSDAAGQHRLAFTRFWTMPESDLEGHARWVWETTVGRIREGHAEDLPKKSDDPVCHVRPHGRDASDTLPTPQGRPLVRKSFWLDAGYLKAQLGEQH